MAIRLGSIIAVAASLALAQTGAAQNPDVASVGPLWERMKSLYLKSTEQMPEAKLSYRPTPDVRTFGQIIGHVINDHYVFCSAALGEKDPNSQDFEKLTTRDAFVKALKESYAYCDRAYAMNDATAVEQVEFFGNKGSRLWVLNFNVAHDSEHYGNLVVYFRLNGMVPPSSQGR